eukprot:Sro153_g069810.3  (484) ;mRNA; f:90234-91774
MRRSLVEGTLLSLVPIAHKGMELLGATGNVHGRMMSVSQSKLPTRRSLVEGTLLSLVPIVRKGMELLGATANANGQMICVSQSRSLVEGTLQTLVPVAPKGMEELNGATGNVNGRMISVSQSRSLVEGTLQTLVPIAHKGMELHGAMGNVNQRTALAYLYCATNGKDWHTGSVSPEGPGKFAEWMKSTSVCSWHGVECFERHVFAVDLDSNNLVGYLPSQLSTLPYLKRLLLGNNSLHDSIPLEYQELGNVTELDLSRNRLTGTIAPYWFTSMPRLRDLGLGNNQFSGKFIPEEIGRATKLEYLRLEGNDMTGTIVSEFGLLTRLRVLSLARNNFEGTIPTFVGRMQSLERIAAAVVTFNGTLPSELGLLTALRVMDFSTNHLSGSIPSQLEALTDMQLLALNGNEKMRGTIPWGVCRLRNASLIGFHVDCPQNWGLGVGYFLPNKATMHAFEGNCYTHCNFPGGYYFNGTLFYYDGTSTPLW